MTTSHDPQDPHQNDALRAQFSALRDVETQRGPSFEAIRSAPPTQASWRIPYEVIGVTALIALLVVGVVWMLGQTDAETESNLPEETVTVSGTGVLDDVPSVLSGPQTSEAAALPGGGGKGHHKRGEDRMAGRLFPPELIVRHAREIGLTNDQKEAIIKEVEAAQGEMARVKLEMEALTTTLVESLDLHPVDEGKALAAAEAVMALEKKAKLRKLQLMIAIRNTLSTEQVEALRQLMEP